MSGKRKPFRFSALSAAKKLKVLLKLWGQVVVARDKLCQCQIRTYPSGNTMIPLGGILSCRGVGPLVGHHILKKGSHPKMRLVLENGIALRKGCHFQLHQHVDDYRGWHAERIGTDRWERLLRLEQMKKAQNTRTDWMGEELFLEQKLNEYGG